MKKGVPRNLAKFTRLRFVNLFKKETLTQVFSCEVSESFKNNFLLVNLFVTASGNWWRYFPPDISTCKTDL